jgi:hypothetical protein
MAKRVSLAFISSRVDRRDLRRLHASLSQSNQDCAAGDVRSKN